MNIEAVVDRLLNKDLMDNKDLIKVSESQLDRVLKFFPRVDAKASVILGIDLGMLGLLLVDLPSLTSLTWYMLFSIVPLILLTISLWYLYKQAFPSLDGGDSSFIYFREIAKRTEYKYIEGFMAQTEDLYTKDLISQIWKNSEILKKKFDFLKKAFIFMALAVLPWVALMAIFILKVNN